MRDYGKVYTGFWSSDDTRGLSDDAKILALYLLTGPHTTIIGCFRLPDAYACEDLGWDSERVSKGFEELFRNGFVTRNDKSRWLVIHKFLRWNQIENPNQAKAARKAAESVPESSGVLDLLASALREFCRFSEGWIANPSERVTQTVSKPETGTGTGTGTGTQQEHSAPVGAVSPPADADEDPPSKPSNVIDHPKSDPVPYLQIVDAYHAELPMLPRCVALTDTRKTKIRARWKSGELPDLETWRAYFADVRASDFLCGRLPPSPGRTKPMIADIDFLIEQRNLVKFQEGKYDNGDARNG